MTARDNKLPDIDTLKACLGCLPDAHLLFDARGTLLYGNGAAVRLFSPFGAAPGDAAGLLPEVNEWGEFGLIAMTRAGETHSEISYPPDSEQPIHLDLRASLVATGGDGGLCVVISLRDVSTLRKTEVKLRTLSMTDELTGLYNRRYLNSLLPFEEERARRFDRFLFMLFMDLDRFKAINDKFGHQVGDAAIRRAAVLLQNSVRKIDNVIRWGGDEFLVMGLCNDPQSALMICRRIMDRFRRDSLDLSGISIRLSGSIGMVVSRCNKGSATTGEIMIARADQLMLEAKKITEGDKCLWNEL